MSLSRREFVSTLAAAGALAGLPPAAKAALERPLLYPPANLAALTSGGVVASPATAWTSGQYVITADMLAANWTGTAWAAGVHA